MKVDITEYGAVVADSLQTEKIQKAIDDCFLSGGGEVIVPCGVFRTGGLRLRSNVTLHLLTGAILEGSENCEDYMAYLNDTIEPIEYNPDFTESSSVYPYSRWNNGLIKIVNAENVSIIGEPGSYIDGMNCYDSSGEENYRGPHAINIQNSENITLRGYTIKNSANWAHAIFKTRDITVQNVTVYAGHDGIDVRCCDNILIEDCTFITGDDGVAGFDNINMIVRNCYFNLACNAFRLGGTDILIENCKGDGAARFGFRGSMPPHRKVLGLQTDENSLRRMWAVFIYYCDFRAEIRRTPGNIVVRNCEFEGSKEFFYLPYGGKWCCNRCLRSIKFENCKVNGINTALFVQADPEEKITLEFENCEVSAQEGFEDMAFMSIRHFDKLSLKNVKLVNFNNPRIEAYTDGEIEIENTDIKVDKIKDSNNEGIK